MRRRLLLVVLEIAVPPVVVLCVWWALAAGNGTYFFPPVADVASTFSDTWLFARVGSDVVPSLARLCAGFALAVLVAVPAGIVLGAFPPARRAADPIVQFLRAIPAPALLPFGILVLGVGTSMKVLLIAFVCVWPILLTTVDGVTSLDPTLKETVRVFQIPRRDRLLGVMLPAASPQIFAGMRTSLSLALILMVISEMAASTNGIGYFVLESQRTFAIAEMWSGILLQGLLGYALNAGLLLAERRALRWHRGARAVATDT